MKNTITLKEFSALPPSVIQITYTSPVAYVDSQPQRRFESVPPLNIELANESFRELLDRRCTTPFHFITPAPRGGINELIEAKPLKQERPDMPFNQPPLDQQLNEQFERASKTLSQILPKLLPIAAVVIVALWLGSGVYSVNPGHVGVVRTFGKETARTEPGLNYRFPWPFQQADVVSVEQIRRIEVGFRGTQRVHEEALMLTGDENIVEAQIVVQYRVADPSKYLFRLREPEVALGAATEVALRSTVGSMTIDQVMIEERAKVQDDARVFIQRLMDTYDSGLVITEVKLQAADPPDAVRDAFHDVVRAREDKEKLINQAKGYQADILPKARGEAQKILREAEGYKEKRVLLAQGEASRFLSVLAEYEKSREVTRDRLHLETMEKILPDTDKVILDSDVGQRLLPMMPVGTSSLLPATLRTATEALKGK